MEGSEISGALRSMFWREAEKYFDFSSSIYLEFHPKI